MTDVFPENIPAETPKEPKNWTHYVHLANGEVRKASAKTLANMHSPHTWRENGIEHAVIGTYPREVEFKDEKEEDE